MASTRPSLWKDQDDEKAEREKGRWKSWVRDIGVAVIVIVVVVGGLYAYARTWPPVGVAESGSMQHGDTVSSIGVLDTGDIVFVQAAPTRADVVTYVEGRATGYSTYGDYGDVILFRDALHPSATPIMHRPILYVIPNGSFADVPTLSLLPAKDWIAVAASGAPTHDPYNLSSAQVSGMGFNHDLTISFDFTAFRRFFPRGAGYITMGDNNAFQQCTPGVVCHEGYDTSLFPVQGDILGHARGEIPWFGLILLLLWPSGSCCAGWGDPHAPANSWNDLAISLVVIVALPFLAEGGAWAWSKYAWPRIKPHVPRVLRRRRGSAKEDASPPEAAESPPREGSSRP